MPEKLQKKSSQFLLATHDPQAVAWRISEGLIDYQKALAEMELRVSQIIHHQENEEAWLLEHSSLYAAGASAKNGDLIEARFPIHASRRGGMFTYHGPGQRIIYLMLDLSRRHRDVRAFIVAIENWLIATLAEFGIEAIRHDARVGVWVPRPQKPRGLNGEIAEDKIAAIGIQIRKWVSFHGVALNICPDLTHYSGIVPCGIGAQHLGVTSMQDLGLNVDMKVVDEMLRKNFEIYFGLTKDYSKDC